MKDIIKQCEKELRWFSIFLIFIQSILIAGLFLNRKSPFLFFGIILVIQIVISILLENKKIRSVSIMLTTIYIPLYLNSLLKIDLGLKIMLYVLIAILIFSFIKTKDIKVTDVLEKIKPLLDFSFDFQLFKNSNTQENNGDVFLCTDIKTRKKVVIPKKDRFLHMLVLGPTGSGKTSQTIIPMINQDMQNPDCGITVIEPKGDLAEKVFAMAQHYGRRAIYFNPVLDACPTFNPLFGKEEDVIENMVTTFKMLNADSPQFFQDMNEQLVRNALKVLKRLKGNASTLIDLDRLVSNAGGEGRKMVTAFEEYNKQLKKEGLKKENEDIISYFKAKYYNEKDKTYEHCSGIRSQVAKIVSNKYLRKVLNPVNGTSDMNFDKHLEEGGIIAIGTAQGKLRDLGKYLGYFIILNFQSSVFKRPGDENTRKSHFLYIDEFQEFTNPSFGIMLTQGRSYRVASHLATQNRGLIAMGGGQDGQALLDLVMTNARNLVIYPDANPDDAEYFSRMFGERKVVNKSKGKSREASKLVGYNSFSESQNEIYERYVTATDISDRPFGEITYKIIKDNSAQRAGHGKIKFIPRDLNDKLDKMIEENNELMLEGINPSLYRDESGEINYTYDEIRKIDKKRKEEQEAVEDNMIA